MLDKRANGVFYTHGNPFLTPAFKRWAQDAGLPRSEILEPFAGENSLIQKLEAMGLCTRSQSYDIAPATVDVAERDTLADFPASFDVCVTNPPWLAKNSATARGLPYPSTHHDDLYKVALEQCLTHCSWVAALVPESFIRADLMQERLSDFVSLTSKIFADTNHPVGLALFCPNKTTDSMIWRDADEIGVLSILRNCRPVATNDIEMRFNDPDGNVGLIALDNTREASIRFCDVGELADYKVKKTGRHITKIKIDGAVRLKEWNDVLRTFRRATGDVLMTCYKGLRCDGLYRRRLDWALARGIVNHVG